MTITCKVTLGDLLAFARHHYANSPAMKRDVALRRWGLPLLVFGLFCVSAVLLRSVWLVVAGAVLWVADVVLLPTVLRRSYERQVRRMYAEGLNRGLLGTHELELTEDGIIERSEVGEHKTTWQGIERIISTTEHTFVYVSALMAQVIPRNAVTEGDYDAFVDALRMQYGRHGTSG